MTLTGSKSALALLNNASLVLFGALLAVFGAISPKFLEVSNLVNIVIQASSTALVAIGMTFVLLTGGVDLSVGAIMFVAAAVAGKSVLGGAPFMLALAVMMAIGLVCGAVNALFILRLRIPAFIVTLATLYVGRGLALWLTETRAMNLPDSFLRFGTLRLVGVPLPVVVLSFALLVAHLVLTRTPFGRQIYATGQDLERARKAGVKTARLLAAVYLISGFCAALGGLLSLGQLGAVTPTFGSNKEFAAIAAAVLGGTSLFGGRGNVFPGTLMGAILIQSIENGLVILNADPYLYPLITSAIILLAALIDSLRASWLAAFERRPIRVEEVPSGL
jgi:ribose transport system permease protein